MSGRRPKSWEREVEREEAGFRRLPTEPANPIDILDHLSPHEAEIAGLRLRDEHAMTVTAHLEKRVSDLEDIMCELLDDEQYGYRIAPERHKRALALLRRGGRWSDDH